MRHELGFPDAELQKAFDETQRRIQARRDKFFGKTSAVVPIDESKLSPVGKAYRERIKNAHTTPKALRLESILATIERRTAEPRAQVLPYEEARIVVDAIYESELAPRNRFIIWDEETDLVLEKITRYFIGDPGDPSRMMRNPDQQEGEPEYVPVDWVPLSKCIYLYGDVGVGKTFLFTVMQTLAKVVPIECMQFRMASAKEIMLAVHATQSMKPIYEFQRGGLVIDDLGEEGQAVVKIYGDEQDPMDILLSNRYRSYIQAGLVTHFTSNKQPSEVEAIYGTRNYDRLREWVHPILFPGISKRPDNE